MPKKGLQTRFFASKTPPFVCKTCTVSILEEQIPHNSLLETFLSSCSCFIGCLLTGIGCVRFFGFRIIRWFRLSNCYFWLGGVAAFLSRFRLFIIRISQRSCPFYHQPFQKVKKHYLAPKYKNNNDLL